MKKFIKFEEEYAGSHYWICDNYIDVVNSTECIRGNLPEEFKLEIKEFVECLMYGKVDEIIFNITGNGELYKVKLTVVEMTQEERDNLPEIDCIF